MADPRVVLVFLASAGRPDPIGPAMTAAAGQALGRDAVVTVEEGPDLPAPDAARARGERARVAAVVEVEWRDATRTHATVRVHGAHDQGWRERQLAFLAGDPPEERGRTIGFAMASLLERDDGASQPQAATPPRPLAGPSDDLGRVMVEAAGMGTLGAGAGTTTGGGEIAGLWLVVPRLVALVTADVRFGSVAPAQSSLTSVQVGAGAAWRFVIRSPLELDLRADLLATYLAGARDGELQSGWLPGARLAVEGLWFPVTPTLGVFATTGAEVALGGVSVQVGSHTVATVAPVRAVGAVGIRARF